MPSLVSTAANRFVLSPRAIEKLEFVHAVISRKRRSKRGRNALRAGKLWPRNRQLLPMDHSHKRCIFADAYDKSRIYLLLPELIRCGMGDAPVTSDDAFLESMQKAPGRTETVARRGESSKLTYHSGGNP